MEEKQIETRKRVILDDNSKRIAELKRWFGYEYLVRLAHIKRCVYFRITPDESLDDLEYEAYEKEQELRSLTGAQPLEEIKRIDIL